MAHILIVDDEPSICWGLRRLALGLGHTAAVAPSAEQGFVAARQQTPDVVFLDVRLPGLDGLSAMDRFHEELDGVPIVIITAFGELHTAVEAVRKGAFEYLVKPFDLALAQRAMERAVEAPSPLPPVARHAPATEWSQRMVGSSPAIQEVFKRIAVVAPAEACVHIRGESGTGKELVARAIHGYSRRWQGPFVAVNAASLSPSLAESELFGHVRGAFTGAEQSRKGLLEQAHGGTLFFDEVAEIPMATQVTILRVLEYGEILPVGASSPVRSDFRIISATHQNLQQRVAEGSFRQDLYYRLITFEIEIPPLRERLGDLPDLSAHVLDSLSAKMGTVRPPISPEAMEVLEGRPWYGNVRELRNALEHAMILARGGAIMPDHLPPPAPPQSDRSQTRQALLASMIRDWARSELERSPRPNDLYQRLLRVVEPPLFQSVLERNHGQYLAAARDLGLHRVTLRRKAARYHEPGG